MKALSAKGRDRFPSVARALHDPHEYSDIVVIGDTRWVVGEAARRTHVGQSLAPQLQRGFHGSDNQHAQICFALGRLDVQGDYDGLVVSLPYGDTQESRVLDKLRACKDYVWRDGTGKQHSVHFDAVHVLPQGVGAMVRYEASTQERPESMFLIDVGSCTRDQVAMRYNQERGRYEYVHAVSRSRRNLNVTDFYNRWLGYIRDIDGLQTLQVGYHDLMDYAIRGQWSLRWGHDTVDIQGTFKTAQAWFTEAMRVAITDDMGATLERAVERIIVTGGGSALLNLDLWDDPRIATLDVWANVEGQYMEAVGEKKDAVLVHAIAGLKPIMVQ